MNNKLLLPTLLALLSGCATYTAPTLTVATGAGSAGLGKNLSTKTTATEPYPPRFSKPLIIERSFSASTSKTRTSRNPVSNQKNTFPPENDVQDNFDLQKNQNTLNNVPLNKYSANNPKNSAASTRTSSAGNPSRYVVSGENYKVLPFSHGFVQRGIASWYGPDFHGEKTSNGETYNMYDMTAAHKSLPIPSYVRVTNLKNKRSVVLRINDRGPFYADRVIDLSYAAAQKLDIHQPGTEMVEVEAIKTSNKESVYLQLGVFSNPANAQILQKKVAKNKMPEPMVKEVLVAGKLAYRVQLGPIFSTDKVNEFNAKLAKMGISETWYVTENTIN